MSNATYQFAKRLHALLEKIWCPFCLSISILKIRVKD